MPNAPATIRKQRRLDQEVDRNAVKIHFQEAELAAMDKRARELSRMDWTDKVRLINQARLALRFQKAFEAVRCRHEDYCEGCDSCAIRELLEESTRLDDALPR